MAVELATGYVSIVPSAQGFGRHLNSQIGPQLDAPTKSITSRFGGMFRSIALAGGGALAAIGVSRFLKGTIEEAREAQQVAKETAARIQSTGASAWTSAGQVEALAGRLSTMAGIDDEIIQGGANLLLTFKNIRNEVGKGNDVFDQANRLAVDMSVAFKQDLKSSAVQLGKALDDPIRGVSALRRVGVSFTQGQQDMIKALVESGDILGAQKIILRELEAQVGGTAAATADPWQKFSVVIGNVKEQIGTALLPVLSALASWLSERLPGALETVGHWFSQAKAVVSEFLYSFRTGFTEDEGTPVERLALRVRELAIWLRDRLVPAVQNFATFIQESAWPAVQRIVKAVGGWKNVLIAAGIAVALMISPLGTLAAALVYAYNRFEGFRKVVDATGRFLRDDVQPLVADFAAYLAEQFDNLAAWTRKHWDSIEEAVRHVIVALRKVIDVWVAYITTLWRQWGDEIRNITKLVWNQIRTYVELVVNIIRGVIEIAVALINGDWGKAWDAIKQLFIDVWDGMVAYVGNALKIVAQLVEGALSALRTIWDIAWQAVADKVSGVMDWVKGVISGGLDLIRTAWETAWSGVGSFFSAIWDGIKSAAAAGINWVIDHVLNPFIGALNTAIDLLNKLPFFDLPTIPAIPNISTPQVGERPIAGDDVRTAGFTATVPGAPEASIGNFTSPDAQGKVVVYAKNADAAEVAERVRHVQSWQLSLAGRR